MKFRLHSLFALVFIAALLFVGWKKYFSPEDNHVEVRVFLENWDLGKSNAFEATDLINRPFPEKPKNPVGCFYRTFDGVSVGLGYSCIYFKTRFRNWNRNNAMKQIDDAVCEFLDAEPKLKIDHFELQEFTREFQDNNWVRRLSRKKTAGSFPF